MKARISCKWIRVFIKDNMPSYIYMTRGVKTLVAFMRWIITKTDALGCVIVKLMLIIISQIWITSTSKAFQHVIISLVFIKLFIWSRHLKCRSRESINVID